MLMTLRRTAFIFDMFENAFGSEEFPAGKFIAGIKIASWPPAWKPRVKYVAHPHVNR